MFPSPHVLTLLLAASTASSAPALWVPTTPQFVRPYALKKGDGIKLPGGNTFPVTGNSSGNAFCLLNTNVGSFGPAVGGFPHVHKRTYENFYAVKGRVQLWGQNLATYQANTSIQQTRVLGPGDLGAIPHNTIHTFTLLEPDTQLTGVLVPGGFEEFFFHISFADLNNANASAALAKWDVYPQPDFVPRQDAVNGKAGPGSWYDGPNDPPAADMEAPIWVAKNRGPKWLVDGEGRYQIVTPFVTGRETNGTFSQGTVTVSPFGVEGKRGVVRSAVATAFMVEEGELEVEVEGFETARLIDGDVVFVPGNTSFSYAAGAEFTKFMYVTSGGRGLDYDLMASAKPWSSAFYPSDSGTQGGLSGRMVRI